MLVEVWMARSRVAFGTSGARGLVSDMTDAVCYAYTRGFLGYMLDAGLWTGGPVGIAGDLRSSSPRIMAACARAISDLGFEVVNGGFIPSPAIAGYGFAHRMPTLMVTGSHIPEDRNGIKFNLPTGEILKGDEQGIRQQDVSLPQGLVDAEGAFVTSIPLPPVDEAPYSHYVARYLRFFPADCLAGMRVGLYEHSSVGRTVFLEVLQQLGARVTRLGHSTQFVSVDTEAIRPEDVRLARDWAAGGAFDALVSADGDADRPLVADEKGEWLRGDIAGILCARYLGIQGVVTPVSSNTALEKSGWFAPISRTRIGSPYVIEGMQELVSRRVSPVAGYEANGGFLLATPLESQGRMLAALPTRDALIVALTILCMARAEGGTVSGLSKTLPARFTHSDRLKAFPTALSQAKLAALQSGDFRVDAQAFAALFDGTLGPVRALDSTDGLRATFESGEIVHLRPSGNAPELRAYTEASSSSRAAQLNARCLEMLESWRFAASS
jgi:phosphomannomutase